MKRELETATAELQSKIEKVQNEAMGQVSKYKEEKEKLEEYSRSTREEAEKARAEHAQQMANLQAHLEKATSASASERDDLKRRISELESRPSGGGCYVM
jgi:predicted RNase H-like nuclease (RuvC/YqgF family)